MRLARVLVIVAVVAALSGAPSFVSAAANELDSPQVTPGSGSVATVFTFRVRYDGAFPATSVSVSVAGLTLPMALESGALTAGWWTTASLLPVGAWPTIFSAAAARGPSARVDGPVVVVAAPATVPPTATSVPTPPGQGGATPDSAPVGGSGSGTTASAAPDVAPAPSEAASAPGSDPATASSAAAGGGTDAATGDGAGTGPDAGGSGGDGDEGADEGAPAASGAGAPTPTGDAAPLRAGNDPSPDGEAASADDLVSTVILIGLAGVALVAMLGTFLLAGGRRREPEEVATNPTAPVAATTAIPPSARRTPRSPANDPIIAALGVDDEMAARRAIRRARISGVADGRTSRPKRR